MLSANSCRVYKKIMRLCKSGQVFEQRFVCLLQTSRRPFGQQEHFQGVAKNRESLKNRVMSLCIPLSFLLFAMQVRMHVVLKILKCPYLYT